jgi:hypothetical protein
MTHARPIASISPGVLRLHHQRKGLQQGIERNQIYRRDVMPAELASVEKKNWGICTVTRCCRLLSAISIFLRYPQNAPISSHSIEACKYSRSRMTLLSFSAWSLVRPSYLQYQAFYLVTTHQSIQSDSDNFLQSQACPVHSGYSKTYASSGY